MSRYETRYLTWRYFSPPVFRLAPGTWAFVCPTNCISLVSSILLGCAAELVVNSAPRLLPYPEYRSLRPKPLLNNHFLLPRVHPAVHVLGGNRNHVLAIWQGGREIVKGTVIADERHFPAVHHHARAHLGLAHHFDHMTMLYEGIEIERHFCLFFCLDDDGKPIFLALNRFLTGRIHRLDGPIICADWKSSHDHARRVDL